MPHYLYVDQCMCMCVHANSSCTLQCGETESVPSLLKLMGCTHAHVYAYVCAHTHIILYSVVYPIYVLGIVALHPLFFVKG